ncbi:MAG TPA: cupin domain-containing protein [Terriglobales bacterium]|nr:cupin domain-containing protein [Terriglobales bacterium]
MSQRTVAPHLAGNVIGAAGNDFVVAEWRDPGGQTGPERPIAPLHLHHQDDEAWYVLEGTLCVRVGEQEIEATPGSAVFVARGTPHSYWNPKPEPVRYLLVMTANIYSLIQEIHQLKERSLPTLRELFKKYHSELL